MCAIQNLLKSVQDFIAALKTQAPLELSELLLPPDSAERVMALEKLDARAS